jgi:hypothetical protein
LSAVGAAFSAGGDAVCGGAVCAAAPELKAKAPASAVILIHDPIACDIAVSFLDSLRDDLSLDHCEAARGCKSESVKKGGVAAGAFRGWCEANHTHLTQLALIRDQARPAPVSKDRTDESAADGLLVVQVCRLGTIF